MDAFIRQPPDSAPTEPETEPDQPAARGPLPPRAVAPFRILAPAACASPLVFASPHSGRHYPDDLGAALSRARLRRLEDALVDQLVDHAPAHGAPLLMASYGRAYVDLNRDPVELDAEMLSDPLPPASRRRTARVAAGLGVIAKRVDGHEIYDRRLALQEAQARIETVHTPYHAALERLTTEARAATGAALLVDWHSMPSSAAAQASERGRRPADMVLGDRHGAACAPAVTAFVERELRAVGFVVARNHPYAGGYTTERHGRPDQGVHALQIEINRALYLDERTLKPGDGFHRLRNELDRFAGRLAQHVKDLIS